MCKDHQILLDIKELHINLIANCMDSVNEIFHNVPNFQVADDMLHHLHLQSYIFIVCNDSHQTSFHNSHMGISHLGGKSVTQ